MEIQEKVGTVLMKPLEALKKICEDNSINRVKGVLLPRYEKIVDNRMKTKEQIPMFSQDTCEQYIGEDIIEELKNEESLEI